jgi:hypothetical protein
MRGLAKQAKDRQPQQKPAVAGFNYALIANRAVDQQFSD